MDDDAKRYMIWSGSPNLGYRLCGGMTLLDASTVMIALGRSYMDTQFTIKEDNVIEEQQWKLPNRDHPLMPGLYPDSFRDRMSKRVILTREDDFGRSMEASAKLAIIDRIDELKTNGCSVKDVCDGYHTFGDLYEMRAKLFAALCNCYPLRAWKTRKHHDNDTDPMYEGMFLAGINTPTGDASYHIEMKYWDLFDNIGEIERGPAYDGHTPDDDLRRIGTLPGIS